MVNKTHMPPGWRLTAFGECAVLVRDTVSPTNMGDMPYVGLEHVGEGTLSLVNSGVATEVTSTKSRFTSNDVLFGKLRPYLRKVARARFDGICSTDIWVVRPAEGVDAGYLFHVMASQKFVDAATRGSEGTKMPRAKWDLVSKIRLRLPPLEEQQRITTVLASIDEAIEHTDTVVAATEQLRDSLLHELLTRGVPSWHTAWKEVRGFGTVPASWDVVRLGDVTEVNPRRPLLKVEPMNSVTFVPMVAVAENCGGIVAPELRPFGEVARGYTYFQTKDVLFAKITPCLQNGKHALAANLSGEFGFGTTEFHVIRAGPSIDPRHLFRILTQPSNLERCQKSFSGTAGQQRVHPDILRDLRLCLPPLTEQRVIAATLDSIDATLERAREERVALQLLKASTSEALLTGHLRIELGKWSIPDVP